MKTFKYYITEIGDSTYPSEYEGSAVGGLYHHYSVKHPTDSNKDLRVSIRHDPASNRGKRSAEVSFTRKEGPKSHAQTNDMSTGESVKVFSTVHKIMKQHAESNPSITHFKFTSDKNTEPTRRSLYTRFAKNRGGTTKSDDENETYDHTIPAKNL